MTGSTLSALLATFREAHPLKKHEKSASVFDVLETLLNIRNAHAHSERFPLGKDVSGEDVKRSLNFDQGYYELITPLIEEAIKDCLRTLCLDNPVITPALEVIKIEDPKNPDVTRSWGWGDDPSRTADPDLWQSVEGGGSSFVQLNRGKKSIGLNPMSADGKDVFFKLLATADGTRSTPLLVWLGPS